jgi:DNA-binding transcriptional MerR regulator
MFTIGKIAALAEITTDALRYYEKEGLIRPAKKSAAGYRLYRQDAVRRVRFIKQAKHCGFSLREIARLLELKTSDSACCSDVRRLALEKKLELEHKVRAMKAMSAALDELLMACRTDALSIDECPILEALEDRAPAHD